LAGLFNFLPVPRSLPVYVVVGTPIEVAQCSDPDEALVDAVHKEYFDEIRRIFERHKKAAGFRSSRLIYV
jgi:hypothetical protein